MRAIVGPNGAGKTTFVSILAGRIRPTRGKIYFNKEEITALSSHERVRRGISLSLQLSRIFPNMTVFENLWIGAQMRSRHRNPLINWRRVEGAEERLLRICEAVGLRDKLDRMASDLSHGDQKLLDIAIALTTDPLLVLLDEPLAGLSQSETTTISKVIRELAETKTVILIEHRIDEVMQIADRVTVLDEGKILVEGSPVEISENEKVQEIYLGTKFRGA